MKSSLPNRNLVRQYLLGTLDDKKDIEGDLSERILFDDEFSEMVDSIEDDIIEEYLDGALDSADKNAVDEYFLRPPERKEKLRFARLLRSHLETERGDLLESRLDLDPANAPSTTQDPAEVRSAVHGRSHFIAYGQFAALILVGVLSLIYISGIRKSQTRLERELTQEKERSASLVKEARLSQSAMVPLTLVSDRSRGASRIPYVAITPSTQRIIVEIALQGTASGSYDVRLESKEGTVLVWTARLLPLVSPSGDARLVFDVPAPGIEAGIYSFVVSSALPGSGGPKHYDFQIALTR